MRIVTWLITNAIALAVATWLVGGISFDGPTSGMDEVKQKLLPLLIVALVLGIVTAFVKPILKFLAFPFIVLTLGLLLLVINAAMLGLTAWILGPTGVGFHVDGFWAAVLGGIIISIVGWGLDRVWPEGDE
ncbi:putative membrane protein [Nocardioides albertanoniae]|uniref:Putative membrane protein n=1 Tax=Nocardioides albertanoniae TaxID=1175486 RepID=A0A543A2A2_9ACTN|nr:phage holin family protein [Nocardioides albertanoniae]TQL66707.1 putative membrane protein [Nocardioides albertanoniae]